MKGTASGGIDEVESLNESFGVETSDEEEMHEDRRQREYGLERDGVRSNLSTCSNDIAMGHGVAPQKSNNPPIFSGDDDKLLMSLCT
jgi:hypothetical protein